MQEAPADSCRRVLCIDRWQAERIILSACLYSRVVDTLFHVMLDQIGRSTASFDDSSRDQAASSVLTNENKCSIISAAHVSASKESMLGFVPSLPFRWAKT
jgi:hypothetical protein